MIAGTESPVSRAQNTHYNFSELLPFLGCHYRMLSSPVLLATSKPYQSHDFFLSIVYVPFFLEYPKRNSVCLPETCIGTSKHDLSSELGFWEYRSHEGKSVWKTSNFSPGNWGLGISLGEVKKNKKAQLSSWNCREKWKNLDQNTNNYPKIYWQYLCVHEILPSLNCECLLTYCRISVPNISAESTEETYKIQSGKRECRKLIEVKCYACLRVQLLQPLQSCLILCDPMNPMEPTRLLCPIVFSKQEYWSGLPCSPPGDLPDPGIKHVSPILLADS